MGYARAGSNPAFGTRQKGSHLFSDLFFSSYNTTDPLSPGTRPGGWFRALQRDGIYWGARRQVFFSMIETHQGSRDSVNQNRCDPFSQK